MKKLTLLSIAALLLFAAGCSKKDSAATTVTPTTPAATNPYFFKFNFNDTAYNFTANFPQYTFYDANAAGGYQSANTFFPSVGLHIYWHEKDTVKESDVLALAGKTLYFSDTAIQPEITFSSTSTSGEWFSIDTASTAYNVKITGVTYLKKDTIIGIPLRTYVLTGTCSAWMYKDYMHAALSGGSYNFIISIQDY